MRAFMLAAAAMVFATATLPAQTLYSDNFDAGTSAANWTAYVSAVPPLNTANFAFDYSTVGIPSAPNSIGGTTIGLQLQANRPGGTATFSGLSVSPNGQSFTGDYRLRFDAFQNFPGPFPAGGTGSTQATGGGIGANPAVAQFPGGTIDGLYFCGTGDGGSALDYRAYSNGGAPHAETSGVYAAGNVAGVANNTNAFYATNLFGTVTAPAAQTALFPATQTGATAAGTLGMAWRTWTIEKNGSIVTWSVTNNAGVDVLLATVDTSIATFELNGTNIFLGQFDVNATQTTAALDPLLFGLIDNVSVTVVPEPGFLAILAAGIVLGFHRRRHTG